MIKLELLRKTYNFGKLESTPKSFFLRFYLFIHEKQRDREVETQAEGEAGSMQGARHGTRSQDSRIMPWAEGRRQTAEPPRDLPEGALSFETSIFLTSHL